MADDSAAVSAIAAAALPADVDCVASLVEPTTTHVLVGDGTHGTSEFYDFRARLSLRLLAPDQPGGAPPFDAVLLEADVPAAAALNAYVRWHPPYDGPSADAADALTAARGRFPRWMWSNAETLAFARALRELNAGLPPADRRGVYGLDIYSLYESAAALVAHFDAYGDGAAAATARRAVRCFASAVGPDASDGVAYAYALAAGARPCADAAVAALVDTARRRGAGAPPVGPPGSPAAEAGVVALLHAQAVAGAEAYYRAMLGGGRGGAGDNTWNIRDGAFAAAAATVAKAVAGARCQARGGEGAPARVIVWAHNSHLGAARATASWAARRETNVGQLLRDAHGAAVLGVGCLTAGGIVAAASTWGGRVRQRALRPAATGSYEALLARAARAAGRPAFSVDLRRAGPATDALAVPRAERMVGVQYKPRRERSAHMVTCMLPAQFDVVVFWAATRAVTPVPAPAGWGDRVVGYDDPASEDSD